MAVSLLDRWQQLCPGRPSPDWSTLSLQELDQLCHFLKHYDVTYPRFTGSGCLVSLYITSLPLPGTALYVNPFCCLLVAWPDPPRDADPLTYRWGVYSGPLGRLYDPASPHEWDNTGGLLRLSGAEQRDLAQELLDVLGEWVQRQVLTCGLCRRLHLAEEDVKVCGRCHSWGLHPTCVGEWEHRHPHALLRCHQCEWPWVWAPSRSGCWTCCREGTQDVVEPRAAVPPPIAASAADTLQRQCSRPLGQRQSASFPLGRREAEERSVGYTRAAGGSGRNLEYK